jgi:hypothetical protein
MKEYGLLIISCVGLVFLACTVSNLSGVNFGIDKVEQEAVLKGHAEWVADTNGKPQFKWKECK